jgi:hypothetical protein
MEIEKPPTTANVASELKALMNEFFGAVSFSEGDRPQYERLHALFLDGAKLIKNSGETPEISTVPQFIAARQPLLNSGELTSFEEVEVADVTEVFGAVAHRWSTYEKRSVLNENAFTARGIVSTQFIRTPNGWKMSAMAWDDERSGLRIPARYN